MGSVVLEPPRLDALSRLGWRAFETAHSALRAADAYLDVRELVERNRQLDDERSNVARLLRDIARDLRGKPATTSKQTMKRSFDEQSRLARAVIETHRGDHQAKGGLSDQ